MTFVRRTKKASTKSTFMLHCPDTLKGLAKLCASSDRYAALKCASRIDKLPANLKNEDGSLRILLRKTNTKIVREFNGNVIKLDKPTEVIRQGRYIVYEKKPVCKYIGKMNWEDLVDAKKVGGEAATPSEEAPVLA
ncbi:hypothetical protein EBT31_20580 [bacterium]|nr:hypothetical protein [bacterium]